jgi:hypothetical protein
MIKVCLSIWSYDSTVILFIHSTVTVTFRAISRLTRKKVREYTLRAVMLWLTFKVRSSIQFHSVFILYSCCDGKSNIASEA